MNNLKYSKHAKNERLQQRAIPEGIVEMIMAYGKREHAPGGCLRIFLSPEIMEKAAKVQVIFSPDRAEIVTIEYRTKKVGHK